MPRCHWLPHGWRQSRAVSVRVLRAEAVWHVADMCDMCDIPGTKAAVGQSSALWREPREAECSRKDPAMPSLVAAPVWAAVAVGQRGGERPALGGHGWVPAAAPAHRSLPGSQPRWVPPRVLPWSRHVCDTGAGHPGPWRGWDMPGGCPLPQGNRAAAEHWAALLQPRWWSLA